MGDWLLGAASALWLGILTSVSPCPLATNITAISYVGRRIKNPQQVFLAGLLYTEPASRANSDLGGHVLARDVEDQPAGFRHR
jgi:hypothetical protein